MNFTKPGDVAYVFLEYALKIHAKALPSELHYLAMCAMCGQVDITIFTPCSLLSFNWLNLRLLLCCRLANGRMPSPAVFYQDYERRQWQCQGCLWRIEFTRWHIFEQPKEMASSKRQWSIGTIEDGCVFAIVRCSWRIIGLGAIAVYFRPIKRMRISLFFHFYITY